MNINYKYHIQFSNPRINKCDITCSDIGIAMRLMTCINPMWKPNRQSNRVTLYSHNITKDELQNIINREFNPEVIQIQDVTNIVKLGLR